MKFLLGKLLNSLLIVHLPIVIFSQGFNFQNGGDAQEFLSGILQEFGLNSKDIHIKPSYTTSNAEAKVLNNKRYIYYNPDWMKNIGSTYKKSETWLKMGILTHEIGHHIKWHTVEYKESHPIIELEADWWSGFAMRKLGATLEQALIAVKNTTPTFQIGNHPARRYRIEAVTKGFNNEKYNPGNLDFPTINTTNLGGEIYPIKRFGKLTWMTKNLNYEVNGSWCYQGNSDYCNKYGRLYTWEAAKWACKKMGWRLPTDQEWWDMAKGFGGAYHASINDKDDSRVAYKALINGGDSGFSALKAGYRSSEVAKIKGMRISYWKLNNGRLLLECYGNEKKKETGQGLRMGLQFLWLLQLFISDDR